jgi:hypothetical protein
VIDLFNAMVDLVGVLGPVIQGIIQPVIIAEAAVSSVLPHMEPWLPWIIREKKAMVNY